MPEELQVDNQKKEQWEFDLMLERQGKEEQDKQDQLMAEELDRLLDGQMLDEPHQEPAPDGRLLDGKMLDEPHQDPAPDSPAVEERPKKRNPSKKNNKTMKGTKRKGPSP